MSAESTIRGPHQSIAAAGPRERFALRLFDVLWDQYRSRVSYVRTYEKVVHEHGAAFVNDHIAFRTFAGQAPTCGIVSLARIFETLGYRAAGCYHFEDKHLSAIHYQHANPAFPKLFISELRVWELGRATQEILRAAIARHRPALADDVLDRLAGLDQHTAESGDLMDTVVDWIQTLPWSPPEKSDVTRANAESQYASWVLVHGYNVNHFTTLVNSQGVPALADIEKTIAALAAAGVPMKKEIEGERGSKLRQSATEAVMIDVPVLESGKPASMPWTYAYFELAERGMVPHPETGAPSRFEGFLGPQATNLFEMTRVS